jgi:pilus assembly protein FimV
MASGRVRKAALAVLAAGGLLTASAGQAASLGRLTVLSGSGEPLRAQIEVTAIQPGEAESLRATLAPADVYRQTQLDHPDFLSSVRLALSDLPDGRKVVTISSDPPIEARVVDLLVDLNWASGRFIRQYSFFVDPPAAVRGASATTDIRVVRGDTLSGVARRIGVPGASVEQVLVALQQANPSAFDSGNVNRLRAGSTLRVPDADTVRSIDPQAARRTLATQQAEFERLRGNRGAGTVARRSGAAPTPQQASGAISAAPTDKPTPAVDERDRLRLSAAGSTSVGTRGTAGALNAAASQDAADRAAEELAAKNKALQEAQSRVSELERNVADMQRLLSVQSAALAEAEARANAASAAALAAPVQSPTVTPPAGSTTPPVTVAPVVPGDTSSATTPAATPAATPADSADATSGLPAYATPQRIGVALVVLLLILLAALLIARRQREKRLAALAAGAALASAAAPSWAEPVPPARAVVDDDDDELGPRPVDPDAPPVRPVDFGFNLDLDKPAPAEPAGRTAGFSAMDDDPPPPLVKSSADVAPEPVEPVVPAPAPVPPAREAYKPVEDEWPKPEPTPARPATAAFAPLVTPDPVASVDLTEDNASKLELADAYLEIGDKEGARELLEDVLKGGTAAQRERAKETLASLR